MEKIKVAVIVAAVVAAVAAFPNPVPVSVSLASHQNQRRQNSSISPSAAAVSRTRDLEAMIDVFVENLYKKLTLMAEDRKTRKVAKSDVKENLNIEDGDGSIYDRMQGDEPFVAGGGTESNNIVETDFRNFLRTVNASTYPGGGTSTGTTNLTDMDYLRTLRNRTKDNWIQALKQNILRQIGRTNVTVPRSDDPRMSNVNISAIIPTFLNNTGSPLFNSDQITEKIRSYYPSCESPQNQEPQDQPLQQQQQQQQQQRSRDDNIMDLYFEFPPVSEKIATATLRLYRFPASSENTTMSSSKSAKSSSANSNGGGDCESLSSAEEDKLLRVSIYWYNKPLQRRRRGYPTKRHLADSKVIPETAGWVDLNVRPATRSWNKGRNLGMLGLAVLVEDQEGNALRADRCFKGAACTVGASTPKPIPTIVVDAARGASGGSATSSFAADFTLLPTVDICTLVFPDNYNYNGDVTGGTATTEACNLRRNQDKHELLVRREQLEQLAREVFVTSSTPPPSSSQALNDQSVSNTRHIRHQRQHRLASTDPVDDPRSRIVNKRVLTAEERHSLGIDLSRGGSSSLSNLNATSSIS